MELYQGCRRFCSGKGLTVEDITFREIKGVRIRLCDHEEIGRPVEEIIPAVTEVLQAFDLPPVSACTGPTTPLNISARSTL